MIRWSSLPLIALLCSYGHTDPPNLAEIDCAVGQLAAEFAASRFPNDAQGIAAAVTTAMHADASMCGGIDAESPPASSSEPFDGGYPKKHKPRSGEVSFYVAPNGDDSADGSLGSPFGTLHRAQQAVRRLALPRPPVVIYLRAGTHYLGQTLELGPEDGGDSEASKVIWRPYGQERVTLSGGLPLSELKWSLVGDKMPGVYKAPLPDGVTTNFTALTLGGIPGVRARYPNADPRSATEGLCFSRPQRPGEACPGYIKAGKSTGTIPLPARIHNNADSQTVQRSGLYPHFDIQAGGYAGNFDGPGGLCIPKEIFKNPSLLSGCNASFQCTVPCSTEGSQPWFAHYDRIEGTSTGFSYDPSTFSPRVASWDHPERAGVVRMFMSQNWGSNAFALRGVDVRKHEVLLGEGGWQLGDTGAVNGNHFYIEGLVEEVDVPGEWAVDPSARTLYIFPNSTADRYRSASNCTVGRAFGCYKDFNSRILPYITQPVNDPKMTLELCANKCGALGYAYAGTESHTQCYCGNALPQETARASDSDCPSRCAANSSETCGGNWHASVFEVMCGPAPPPMPPPTHVEVAVLHTLVSVMGSSDEPVMHIEIGGVRFAHAALTQLSKRYEIPSGGDWAIGRIGAVFIENAEAIAITDSVFDSVGGNGVFLSKHVTDCVVSGCRFAHPGDSGIAAVGVSNLADGTAQTFPRNNLISHNWIHDIGTFGKQVSCYFQAVSGNNTIADNVCYNGPRAGININDGFLGGNALEGNFVANMVRETSDHGPFNSWDRVPYLTEHSNGSLASIQMRHHIRRNFIVNGYNGVWALDHDDGSSYYNDTENFLIYGGCKNYKGDHKICGPGNVILFPGINYRSSGGHSCQTNDNQGNYENMYIGNDCVQQDGQFYTFSGGSTDRSKNPTTYQNRFYSPDAKFHYGKNGLRDLQAAGMDQGSTVSKLPSVQEMMEMGRRALGMSTLILV